MSSGVIYGFSYTGEKQVQDVLQQVNVRFNQQWNISEAVLKEETLALSVDSAEYSDLLGLDSVRFAVLHLEEGDVALLVYPEPLKIASKGSLHLKHLPTRGSARAGWGTAELFGAMMSWDELPNWVFYETGDV